LKIGLPIGFGSVVLGYYGEDQIAKQLLLETFVLPRLVKQVDGCEGSVCFVVETTNLSSLKRLWTSYKDGSLREKLKKVINEIKEVQELTDGSEIAVTVEIDEDEYCEACWVLALLKIEEGSQLEQTLVEPLTNRLSLLDHKFKVHSKSVHYLSKVVLDTLPFTRV
jgi:hypothetical protein